jgi:hypothetical protein
MGPQQANLVVCDVNEVQVMGRLHPQPSARTKDFGAPITSNP